MTKQQENKRKYYLAHAEECKEKARIWYQANSEKIKTYHKINKINEQEYKKNWYAANAEECKERVRIHRKNNREEYLIKGKIYRDNNKDIEKKWREANAEYRKEYKKKWNQENSVRNNEKLRERKKNDPVFKLTNDMRRSIAKSFTKNGYTKTSKTCEILGCTFEELKLYIEGKFEPWMTWDNKGNWNGIPNTLNTSWDVDHIIPLVTAKTVEDVIRLNHYTNLQPLCSYINRHIKKDNI